MLDCSRETVIISSLLLDKQSVKILESIVEGIENDVNYDASPLWEFQSSLIPTHFNHNIKNITVPIQCAKDEIEICNVNRNAKYVILYCGRYLEEVIRYFLSIMHPVLRLRYKILSCGSLIKKLEDLDFIPKDIIEASKAVNTLSNKCLNLTDTITTAKDAVIMYICSQLVGAELLKYSDIHVGESEQKCLDSFYNIDIKN